MWQDLVHSYWAYGLEIRSSIPLPELCSGSDGNVDVVIHIGTVVSFLPTVAPPDNVLWATPEEVCLYWPVVGAFLIRQGREIVVQPVDDVESDLVRLPLLGAVLAVLLHQRGYLVLHASAVLVGQGAVAFIGNKGDGKSTMAAALLNRGHALIADDLVAVDTRSNGWPLVSSGFPQMKLYASTAETVLGDRPDDLLRLASVVDKRARRAADQFTKGASPLAAVCVLTKCGEISIKRLEPQAALVKLIANSYIARFGRALFHANEQIAHLQACASVTSQLGVHQLERPRDLKQLPAVVTTLERHLATTAVS